MARLFGTDGIRGVANTELTPELAFKVARSAGVVLGKEGKGSILIGKDTRHSGDLIESGMIAGFLSIGIDVLRLGVIPTPAVAYLTRKLNTLAGVVISASHNPYEYNGIKFFSNDGYKLSDEVEDTIEELIFSDTKIFTAVSGDEVGRVYEYTEGLSMYSKYLESLADVRLDGYKIGLDLGNGALYSIAPQVLKNLGAEVVAINTSPNGKNINENCGSTNPELISKLVVEEKCDLGFSFDGDADRIIAVDENGSIVDGDHILAICAKGLFEQGALTNNGVVGTIMSNIGLERYLSTLGVNLVYAKVGDRYVLEDMRKNGYVLGGEQSGHIIFLRNNTTGDGLATGLHILETLVKSGAKFSELNGLMTSYPQVLKNAKVRPELKYKYMDYREIVEAIDEIKEVFQGEGRVVIRPSGTEPIVRVMIEGSVQEELESHASRLVALIEETLN